MVYLTLFMYNARENGPLWSQIRCMQGGDNILAKKKKQTRRKVKGWQGWVKGYQQAFGLIFKKEDIEKYDIFRRRSVRNVVKKYG